VKAIPLAFSPAGREIMGNWRRARELVKAAPRSEFRGKIEGELSGDFDAVACAIYKALTGVEEKKAIESGAVDLMQIAYGHVFKMDRKLDARPTPNLGDAGVERDLRENFVAPSRSVFEKRVGQLFPGEGSNEGKRRALLKVFDDFNEAVFLELKNYQGKEEPTLQETLDHRQGTVGSMAKLGVKLMDYCTGRSEKESEEAQEAFFHAAMAAQIHDDLTDVREDELAGTRENMVHAMLRDNGEFERAKPFFNIMTASVLKRVAPNTFAAVKKFEKRHISQIPEGRRYEILRRFPTVF
jgi:hypothetical protein